jgi:hypothetical protein
MEWNLWLVFFVLHKLLFQALLVPLVHHQKHFKHFSTVSFIVRFILRPTVINKHIICYVLPRKYSTWSIRRTGCSSKFHIVTFIISSSNTSYLPPSVQQTATSNETNSWNPQWINRVCWYMIIHIHIHHFKATDLSYVRVAITFVSSFVSLLERRIKLSVQLEIAKRELIFWEERKKWRNNF